MAIKTNQLKLYRGIIAVCSVIHTKKNIDTVCGQKIELFFMLNLMVQIVTIEPHCHMFVVPRLAQPNRERGGVSRVWVVCERL